MAVAVLILQVGCGTQSHRARQYNAEFGAWPMEVQERVLAGVVEKGDSREMVYVALGSPLRVLSHGDWERWEYLGWVDESEAGEVVRTTNDAGLPHGWSGRESVVWQVDFRGGAVISSAMDSRPGRSQLRQGLSPMRMPAQKVN